MIEKYKALLLQAEKLMQECFPGGCRGLQWQIDTYRQIILDLEAIQIDITMP